MSSTARARRPRRRPRPELPGCAPPPRAPRGARARLALLVVLLAGVLTAARAAGTVSPLLLLAIEERFQHGFEGAVGEQDNAALAAVQSIYAGFGFAPLWVTDAGADTRARELAQAIRALHFDGLDPEDYHASRIAALLDASDPRALSELELRLSLALVTAASDLASGRLQPHAVNPQLFIYPRDVERSAVLAGARGNEDIAAYLQSFQPGQANYHRLKDALADYRRRAGAEDRAPIPAGETLERGMTGPRVAALRDRLESLGDVRGASRAGSGPRDGFDETLEEAVRRFQDRHGLDIDGRAGKQTLAALNVPLSARVEQMLLNMERRRWMPDTFEDRYVFVNLADFELKVVERIDGHERTIHTTEVVVGKTYHQTPEFSDRIRYMVLNPYWNVPVSIARNELLPKIKADPGYLAEHGYELLDSWSQGAALVDPRTVDWQSVTRSGLRYKIRQTPGPQNALGRIKFMFPNSHNIYLHDTPARTLFKRTRRAFSHGCIRVKDPEALAGVLLKWQSDWTGERVRRAIEDGERTVVSLAQPMPIHLAYITAWVNKNGTVHFREDIYGRDAALAKALFPPAPARAAAGSLDPGG